MSTSETAPGQLESRRDPLLSIGMFSRASLLSVKALRAYHEAGILVPARIDPSTGYRSYDACQLTDAAVLRRLRELDVPLAEVRRVLDARDPQVTRDVLATHAEVMRTRLAQVESALTRLTESLDHPVEQTPVHLRDDPALLTLEVRRVVVPDDFGPFLGEAYGELWRVLQTAGLALSGPGGALYPVRRGEESEVTAYVPVDRDVALPADRGPVGYGEVPGARVAVLTHHGSYADVGDTYRLLGAWIASHATPVDAPVREVYAVGPMDTDDPAGYRTDICWPVAHATHPHSTHTQSTHPEETP